MNDLEYNINRGIIMRTFLCLLILASLFAFSDSKFISQPEAFNECTIGVFSGSTTEDGRPIIWKNRDVTNGVQKYCYFPRRNDSHGTTFSFIGNVYSDDTNRVYMGLNEVGFAIINANSYNLNDSLGKGIDDGLIMRLALERCGSLHEFEGLLDETNAEGRKDTWNFGALDAEGNVAMYECANHSYTKFSANDSLQEFPGVVIRATFSLSGGDNHDGEPRYKRAGFLIKKRLQEQRIDINFILQTLARDLANPLDDPYPLPYNGVQNGRPSGFILAEDITINRTISRSCGVIRGVLPGEDPGLSTIYAMIGPPVLSIVYPLWVKAREIPAVLNSGSNVPMYSQILRRIPHLYPMAHDNRYLNSQYLMGKDSIGLYSFTLPLEREILFSIEQNLAAWRLESPDPIAVAYVQNSLAESIFDAYEDIPVEFASEGFADLPANEITIAIYPNPFNTTAFIDIHSGNFVSDLEIDIINILGQQVRHFGDFRTGEIRIIWDGRDDRGSNLTSGVYFIAVRSDNYSSTRKIILLK